MLIYQRVPTKKLAYNKSNGWLENSPSTSTTVLIFPAKYSPPFGPQISHGADDTRKGDIPIDLPSGEPTKSHGKSPCFMGKSTISMAIFNSFLYVHQRVSKSYHIVYPHDIPSCLYSYDIPISIPFFIWKKYDQLGLSQWWMEYTPTNF